MSHTQHQYQPFYCEENVWKLCQEPVFSGQVLVVVFISNEARACPLWHQRAAPSGEDPVLWDYHVVLLARKPRKRRWKVWDLDSNLVCPLELSRYLSSTFPYGDRLPRTFIPRFRAIDALTYRENFSSDRSHMLNEAGQPEQAPPPWPPVLNEAQDMNLMSFVDMDQDFLGEVLSWKSFCRRYLG